MDTLTHNVILDRLCSIVKTAHEAKELIGRESLADALDDIRRDCQTATDLYNDDMMSRDESEN